MINKRFWQGKKVLITGHTGFKGGWLSLWLKHLGAKVSGYSLSPITNKNFFDITKLKNIFDNDFRKNIQNMNDLSKAVKKIKPQIIFHLAAQPQVLESYNNPYNTVLSNTMGTTNILEIGRKFKFVKSIVIITTDKVYKNNERKIKFNEDDPLGGDDLYSSSKASADIITLSYLTSFYKNKKCGLAVARAGNCIGGGDWTKYRILSDCSNSFLKNKNLIIRNPKSRRPWQHVFEPLLGYIMLGEKIFKNKYKKFNGAWNFGPNVSNHVNVEQFAKILKRKMKSNSKLIVRLKKNDKREKTQLDLKSQKSKKLLGWRSFLNINQTLQLTADWYLAFKKDQNMFEVSKRQVKDFMKNNFL